MVDATGQTDVMHATQPQDAWSRSTLMKAASDFVVRYGFDFINAEFFVQYHQIIAYRLV